MIIKEKKLVVEDRGVDNPVVVKIGSLDHNFIPGTKAYVKYIDAIFEIFPGALIVPEFTRLKAVGDVLIVRYGSRKNGWMPTVGDCEKLQTFLDMQPYSTTYSKVVVIPEIFKMKVEDKDGAIVTLDSTKAVKKYGCDPAFINEHVQRAGIIFDMLNEGTNLFRDVIVK